MLCPRRLCLDRRGPADWCWPRPDSPPTRYEAKALARGAKAIHLEFAKKRQGVHVGREWCPSLLPTCLLPTAHCRFAPFRPLPPCTNVIAGVYERRIHSHITPDPVVGRLVEGGSCGARFFFLFVIGDCCKPSADPMPPIGGWPARLDPRQSSPDSSSRFSTTWASASCVAPHRLDPPPDHGRAARRHIHHR